MGNACHCLCGGFTARELHFGDFILDEARYRLQRGDRKLRLEKLPMELLILLAERQGELVSRDEIAKRLWGKDVFLDVDHSINTAVRKIRLVLQDDPDKPRFIETVVGKGYRFAAPVTDINGRSPVEAPPEPLPVQPPEVLPVPVPDTGISARRVWLIAAVMIGLFGLAMVLVRGRGSATEAPTAAIKSLAVLPLKNLSGDPSQQYFADGMTDAIIGRLASIHGLRVISYTSVLSFKDTHMSAPEIAKAMHVDALVEGSVVRDGNRVRVNAQLIRGATDEHLWSEAYDRDLPDILALQSDVAQAIAAKVEVTMTGKEQERLTAVRAVSPEVYESYLQGQSAYDNAATSADFEKSIGYFQQAIRQDPTFAPAYLGLAASYDNLGTVFVGGDPGQTRPLAMRAARKALELDPDLPDAHMILGDMLLQQWQWAEAEAEFRRALELSPNNAEAHASFADWLICQGRSQEAVDWVHRARELDPVAITGDRISWILFQSRRYEEAIRESRSVIAVHPDAADALWGLGFALIGDGRPAEAVPVLEKAVTLTHRSPGTLGLLASAYARSGQRTKALQLVDELKRRQQTGFVPAAAFVNANLGLGDYDQAFAWLERAYAEQSNILQFLKVHPFFDPLRGDPRFADLMRRVGLSQ